MNRQQAAGFIETHGYIPAIEAADACLKSAAVTLAGVQNAGGGLITVVVRGDVGSTKAAIEAGTLAADQVGQVISSHVIARPVDELDKLISHLIPKPRVIEHPVESLVQDNAQQEPAGATPTQEELEACKAEKLRQMARKIENFTMSKKKIKFARKKELVQAILAHYRSVL